MRGFLNNIYWKNKLYTLSFLFCVYGGVWLFAKDDQYTYWALLVLVYIVTGYGHFFMGFMYQIKGIVQSTEHPTKNLLKILGVTAVFSALFIWSMYFDVLAPFLLIFIIMYFMYHGALNERTLYKRYVGEYPRKEYLPVISVVTFWVFLDSFRHPGVFFDLFNQIDIELINSLQSTFLQQDSFARIFVVLSILTALWLVYVLARLVWDRAWTHLLVILGILTATAALWWVFNPIDFVFFLSLILAYHFVMWWFVYAQVFFDKEDKSSFKTYIWLSIIIHGALIVFAGIGYYKWMNSDFVTSLFTVLFAISVFRVTTFIHITTSLFNENLIKDLFKIR